MSLCQQKIFEIIVILGLSLFKEAFFLGAQLKGIVSHWCHLALKEVALFI